MTQHPNASRWRQSGRRRRTPSVISSALVLVALAFLPGITQCDQATCYDVDEQGNRTEFDCVSCIDIDDDPCSADSWNLPPGSTCALSQRPFFEDGTECGDDGTPGICTSGICEPTPFLAAGSGSTTWHAPTNPPGGGVEGSATGGCPVFVVVLNTTLLFDTTVTLHTSSDGAGNVTLGYEISLTNALLPVIADAAEHGGISLPTTLSGAAPSQGINGANPNGLGQTIRSNIVGTELIVSVARGSIAETTIGVTPTSFQDVNINWAGDLLLDFTLQGFPLFSIGQPICDFTEQGAGVDLPIGGCSSDAECDDGRECTFNRCDEDTNRCLPALPTLEGQACDPGTGSNDGQCTQGTCLLATECRIGATVINEGGACTPTTGSSAGTCSSGACISADECATNTDCSELDGNACTTPVCDTSGAPYVCTEIGGPADGNRCGSLFDLCDGGNCVQAPVVAAGSGSTTWRATTSPPGGLDGAVGGCDFASLSPTDVEITMQVDSDGLGNVTVGYDLTMESFLLPQTAPFAVTGFTSAASVENAITSLDAVDPILIGTTSPLSGVLGDFLSGNVISFATPADLSPTTVGVAGKLATSTSASFELAGTFELSVIGFPMDESVCTFDVQGLPVVLPLVQP